MNSKAAWIFGSDLWAKPCTLCCSRSWAASPGTWSVRNSDGRAPLGFENTLTKTQGFLGAPLTPGDLLLEIDILSAVLLLFYIMFTIFSVLNARLSVRVSGRAPKKEHLENGKHVSVLNKNAQKHHMLSISQSTLAGARFAKMRRVPHHWSGRGKPALELCLPCVLMLCDLTMRTCTAHSRAQARQPQNKIEQDRIIKYFRREHSISPLVNSHSSMKSDHGEFHIEYKSI